MKRVYALLLLSLILGWGIALFAQDASPVQADSPKSTGTAKADALKESTGVIVIEEDLWLRLADQPSKHMRQAHEKFLKEEFKTAGHEISLAAAYLHAAVGNSEAEGKAALLASGQELDKLAADVKTGAVKSEDEMKAAFARAEHALAVHHHAKAKSAIASQQTATGGSYLRSAVNHVVHGAKWAGNEFAAETATAASAVRLVARKMAEKTEYEIHEAGKGVKWIETELMKMSKYIQPQDNILR